MKIGETCFPEHVDKSFFINTPWFFSASWAVVNKVLDKDTRDKTVISRHDCKKQLIELLGSEELLGTLWTKSEQKIAQK